MKIGDNMPEFSAKDQNGTIWTAEALRGKKTVLYAYPKDSTPGCTAEACDLRDNYNRFLALGYNVLGISKDSMESHVKFAAKYALPFPLLSDPDHTLLEALGAWGEKKLYGKVSMGTLRKTFLFDEEGRCTEIIEKVDTKNHTAQILK
ncbi:MAG: peroxiredoxin [Bacteroidales bacterium]|nr:peroxiredoxin [Bacteroidales bacterium]